jgi:hypothetical protein
MKENNEVQNMNEEKSMNAYEERQALKLERFEALSEKAARESISARSASDRLSGMIPFGQPILIGHHSEARHRRDLDRIHNGMRKSIDLAEKSEYYAEKAARILNPSSISSDDPEAILKLKEKLAGMMQKRAVIKARSHEGWELSNLSGNMRRVKDRIEQLEQHKQDVGTTEVFGDVTFEDNPMENRIKVFFPGVPSIETRAKLKSNGFRWTPSQGCWQAYRHAWNLERAREIIKEATA